MPSFFRFVAILIIPISLLGQTAPPLPAAPPPPPPTWAASSPVGAPTKFEVASVKPHRGDEPGGGITPSAGRLTATNTTLENLVMWAYSVKPDQISGAPAWFRTDRYDVAAKAYRAPDWAHLQLVLRELLQERFQMALHREPRQMPVYELHVKSRGLKMKPALGPIPPDQPQMLGWSSRVIGQHASMTQLCSILSRRLGRPVVDKTGATGTFDFQLEYSPDDRLNGPSADGVSLFTAIRQQLGLRLEASKGTVQVLVIDHAERIPSAN